MRFFLPFLAALLAAPAGAAKPKHTVAIPPGPKHIVKTRPAPPPIPGCPRDKKDWLAKGPKILVEKALRQHLPIEVPDFRARLGKKNGGAVGTAAPFQGAEGENVLVSAEDKASGVFLSGVLRCDREKRAPVLKSLTYVKGSASGIASVVDE